MAYISTLESKVGKWVITTKKHEAICGYFEPGTRVKVIDVDPMRGYAIEDEFGNQMIEIGWEI